MTIAKNAHIERINVRDITLSEYRNIPCKRMENANTKTETA
jgi:hypothetical protein